MRRLIWCLVAVLAGCGGPPEPTTAPGGVAADGSPVPRVELDLPEAPATDLGFVPRVRPYRLPLKADAVVNLERDFLNKARLPRREELARDLLQNGVVVGAGVERFDRFTNAYEALRRRGIPTVVTADSVR